MKTPEPKTLIVSNFNGRATRFRDGDINSGKANYYVSWGYDTLEFNGTLTFSQGSTDITKSVVTDLIMAGRIRVESAITYLYAIGHTGRLYKIQVNNTSTKNPDYDTPVLLATLANSQTFKFGASLEFYQGSGTEKIWIGHDTGLTKINFDGSNETNFTSASFVSNVPRQLFQFIGSLFFTNGSNIGYVDSTELVISYTKLSPGFPANMTSRDIRNTADGRYLVTVITRNPSGDNTLVVPNASEIAAMPSELVYWDGTSLAASSSTSFPSFTQTAYYTFSDFEYVFGYNIAGFALATPQKVIILPEFANSPHPNAVGSSGDFMGWGTTLFDPTTGHTKAVLDLYGTIDSETPVGLYRQLIQSSTLTGGDVVRIPFFSAISLGYQSGSTAGYYNASTNPLGEVGSGKTYFSTLEYDGVNTHYGFYMFKNVQDFLTTANTGVYETQHQIFTKKVKATEVRVYFEPVVANGVTSFQLDLVGINGAVISGTTKVFTPVTTDGDRLKYVCEMAPQSCLGLRITNVGFLSPYIHRVEIDYIEAGN